MPDWVRQSGLCFLPNRTLRDTESEGEVRRGIYLMSSMISGGEVLELGNLGVWFRVPKGDSQDLRKGTIVQAFRSYFGLKEGRRGCRQREV